MASIRERILQGIADALKAAGKPPGLTVHRFPELPLPQDNLPAAAVFPTDDEDVAEQVELETYGDGEGSGAVLRTLPVSVQCRASTTIRGDPIATTLDPLYLWTVRQVMKFAVTSPLVRSISEVNVRFGSVAAERIFGAHQVDFAVEYTTRENDPEAQ